MTAPAPVSQTAPPTDRLRRGFGAASQIGVAPIALALAMVMPLPVEGGRSLLGLPSLCVFHLMTGLPCPGCGITRSVVCCAHLDFTSGVFYHPAGPAVFLWLVAVALLRLPVSAPLRARLAGLPKQTGTLCGFALVLSLLVVWGARLTGWLPSPP